MASRAVIQHQRILFVCTGNQCRSPMAEAILKDMIRSIDSERQGSKPMYVRSAGTSCVGQQPASDEPIQVMHDRGLEISSHRSRHVDEHLIDWANIILVMENIHKRYILERFPDAEHKVHLLTEFMGEEGDIPDPVRNSIEIIRQCADRLESLLHKLLRMLL